MKQSQPSVFRETAENHTTAQSEHRVALYNRAESITLHRAQTSRHFWRELASLVCWTQAKPILALSGFSLNAQISGLQLAPWRPKSICTMEDVTVHVQAC